MKSHVSSQEIEARLGAIRARIRRVQAARGIAIVGTAALAGLMAIMAVDFLLSPLPTAVRLGLFAAWLIGIAAAAKSGLAPAFREIRLIQIARWLEGRHPEIEERLSTVLELSQQDAAVSPEMLTALAAAAEKDLGGVDPLAEIRNARTRMRWGRPAIVLLAILGLGLAIWPSEASRLLVRAVIPFSNLGNAGATRFTITPGDLEVLEGDPIEIKIACSGDNPTLDFWMEMTDGTKFSQTLTRSGNEFRYRLDPARQSFRYHLRAGRAESDTHTATVWPLPAIQQPQVDLDFPEYTRLPAAETPLGRGIAAVAGTQVTLTGTLNTPVEEAWLESDGQRIGQGTVESSATGGRVSFSWKLEKSGVREVVAKLRHRLGRELEALRFQVEATEDKAPLVLLISPSQRELRVRPDESFKLRYEVTEDFAVSTLGFEVEAGKSEILPKDLPQLVRGSVPQSFRGSGDVVIGALRSMFPDAREMKIRVRAADARPSDLGGPGVGYSEWIRLKVDQGAESFARQELRQEHDGARETLEAAIRETREARDRIQSQREEIKKDELSRDSQKHLQQAAEKLASADQKLTELATRMEDSVHATKAESVENAAKEIEKSLEKLETAPLQDSAEQRREALEQATAAADQALKQLEEVRQKLDQDRERVQDLARVEELAQQQREVARQAEENLAALSQDQPTPEEWRNRQKQMEEALRQQLRERPKARAEALQAQAEQAKALAEQAQAMAVAQKSLQEQAAKAEETADPAAFENAVRVALSQEQAAIANEAKAELAQAQQDRTALADTLPQASAAADQAQEQLAKSEDSGAAESATAAASAMRDAAAKADPAQLSEAAQAESLNDLAKRQDAVAEAIDSLGKNDPAAALQALQSAKAEAAAELTRAIQSAPRVDGSGPMQEAANNAADGARKAATAAEQAGKGEQKQAASQHAQSGEKFQTTAQALGRAAEEFSRVAQELAAQQANAQKAPVAASDLAEAFQQASQAATQSEPAAAALQAANAAQALTQAAQAARQQMQGRPPGMPQPGPPGNAAPAAEADEADDPSREPEPSPGLPPELARLGISATDWEKIQATLNADVGSGGADAIPEEYRNLVKGYFESMTRESPKK